MRNNTSADVRLPASKGTVNEQMRLKNALYILLGFIGLALGAVGAAVPLLPAFPFLVLAAFGFARGSERMHQWFLNTRLYKNNLESFMAGRGMTWGAKARLMATVTVVMLVGFIAMRRIPWGQAVLGVIWAGHILLFLFGIRTIPGKGEQEK